MAIIVKLKDGKKYRVEGVDSIEEFVEKLTMLNREKDMEDFEAMTEDESRGRDKNGMFDGWESVYWEEVWGRAKSRGGSEPTGKAKSGKLSVKKRNWRGDNPATW